MGFSRGPYSPHATKLLCVGKHAKGTWKTKEGRKKKKIKIYAAHVPEEVFGSLGEGIKSRVRVATRLRTMAQTTPYMEKRKEEKPPQKN